MLSAHRTGQGTPLVFLHAFPLSKLMWVKAHKGLSNHYQVISIDLPGFGESPPLNQVKSIKSMADEVMLVLKHLIPRDKFFLFGVSMGGYVALEILRSYADRIRGLRLISTRATPYS